MIAVYVSGPYSGPNVPLNVQKAIETGAMLRDFGFAPLVPHLTMLEDMHRPRSWEHWIATDLAWVRKADAVFRMAGESKGADIECEEAALHGVPVFRDVASLMIHFEERVTCR